MLLKVTALRHCIRASDLYAACLRHINGIQMNWPNNRWSEWRQVKFRVNRFSEQPNFKFQRLAHIGYWLALNNGISFLHKDRPRFGIRRQKGVIMLDDYQVAVPFQIVPNKYNSPIADRFDLTNWAAFKR